MASSSQKRNALIISLHLSAVLYDTGAAMSRLAVLCLIGLSQACRHQPQHDERREPAELKPASTTRASSPPTPQAVEPIVLTQMPVSAYVASLALDDEATYLMTPNAAYRLVAGQRPHGIELALGTGPVLTRDAFIYWHNGTIWRIPKMGGQSSAVTKLPHQPQYFVSSGVNLAWVDRDDVGIYTIQSLDGRKPRVLVKAAGELSALNMMGNFVFFVQKEQDSSWRIGKVQVTGGELEYAASKRGPTPSMLTGKERIVYWDLGSSEIRTLSTDLEREETWLKNFVCSPNYEAGNIYCGCVEGLFVVRAGNHQPSVLSHGRHETVTFIRANSKRIAWIVDQGPNQLAVNLLAVSE
jgi:hypothetical protein